MTFADTATTEVRPYHGPRRRGGGDRPGGTQRPRGDSPVRRCRQGSRSCRRRRRPQPAPAHRRQRGRQQRHDARPGGRPPSADDEIAVGSVYIGSAATPPPELTELVTDAGGQVLTSSTRGPEEVLRGRRAGHLQPAAGDRRPPRRHPWVRQRRGLGPAPATTCSPTRPSGRCRVRDRWSRRHRPRSRSGRRFRPGGSAGLLGRPRPRVRRPGSDALRGTERHPARRAARPCAPTAVLLHADRAAGSEARDRDDCSRQQPDRSHGR